MNTKIVKYGLVFALLFATGPAWRASDALSAQQRDSLEARLLIPGMPMQQAEAPPAPPPLRRSLIFPGLTVSSPAAFGAEGGTVYAGVGYQERTRYLQDDDGALFLGLGLGDAREYVALDVTLTSTSTWRTGLFNRVSLGVQVERELNPRTAIAVGAENLAMLKGETDSFRSFYGVLTRLFPLKSDPTEPFSLITATIGLGDGRFRFEEDVWDDRSTVNVFGAVSVHVVRPVALIADWTGQDLALGASIAPFSSFPLVITPAFMDVTHNAGDGTRFVIAAGIGHRLRRGPIQF